MIAGQREHLSCWNSLLAISISHPHSIWFDAQHVGFKHGAYFAGTDAILDVRFHPVFQTLSHFRAAMNQSDSSSRAKQIESCFRSRVPSADDDNILVPVRVRFAKIMTDVRQILARNSQDVGQVVVPGSQ